MYKAIQNVSNLIHIREMSLNLSQYFKLSFIFNRSFKYTIHVSTILKQGVGGSLYSKIFF